MLRSLALVLLAATAVVLALPEDDGRSAQAVASGPVRLVPLPEPPAAGGGGHAFADERRDATGRPVLFDPCRPVRWAVRRDGELPGADALLGAAVAEVAAASGLLFERSADVGGALPNGRAMDDRAEDGSFPPALVAWSTEAERPGLGDGALALGGGTTWAPEGRPGEERLVSGLVVLDREDLAALRAGPDGEARLAGVLRHELAHLVGLGHVDDPTQLMHARTTGIRFAPGDLRGLRAAGQGQCFQDW